MPQHYIGSIAFLIFALAGWLTAMIGSHRRFLHLLQLEDYETGRMLREIVRYPRRLQLSGWELFGIPVILILANYAMFLPVYLNDLPYTYGRISILIVRTLDKAWLLAWFIWGTGCLWHAWRMRIEFKSTKKPLVMTTRAKRIFWTSLIISILSTFAAIIIVSIIRYNNIYLEFGCAIVSFSIKWAAYFWISVFVIMYLCERMIPIFLVLAVILMKPVESSIQNRYLNDAKRILREVNPLVIGITGSYGKTGTKEILSAILAEKYNVYKPPGSYNTLMGVTRIIREELRPYHEVFIAEMGAYRIGSIEKLCNLVKPTHGIITIIGLQHLERFKTQENIKKAKSELVKSLPKEGIAVLNGDDPLCREIGGEFKGKVVYFSVEDTDNNISGVMRPRLTPESTKIENIRIGADGSDFDLVFIPQSFGMDESKGGEPEIIPPRFAGEESKPEIILPSFAGGESKGGAREMVQAHLSLLGRSAIYNAAAAAAMADQLGVPRKSIAKALALIPHVKHRLEPIRNEGGITVLDDAFNSNPIGAKNALEVLASASSGRRILVTPGMVELGSMEEEANYEFGRQAATACDLAVLVGKQRIEPIKRGLIEAGFNVEQIWVVDSLNVGLERLKSYLNPGDTMLLENDLPDQYDKT